MAKYLYISLIGLLLCLSACKQTTPEKPLKNTIVDSPKLQSVFINGDSIHYMEVGKGEPVVFVHGSLGNHQSWGAQIDTFSMHHRVIAYSRRYAQPNKQVLNDSADYSVLIHAKDLASLIKSLNLGPVHLVGHSWGAFTALKTTIDHPELVKTLVLGEPPVHSLIENTKVGDSLLKDLEVNTFQPSAKAFMQNDNIGGITLFIGGVMGDSLAYSKAPQFVQERWKKNFLELRGVVVNRSFITIPPEDVQSLTTPVLVIKGELSPLFLKVIANKLDSLLPNSQLFILPNSSHGLQSSNPEVFNKTVLDFISNK